MDVSPSSNQLPDGAWLAISRSHLRELPAQFGRDLAPRGSAQYSFRKGAFRTAALVSKPLLGHQSRSVAGLPPRPVDCPRRADVPLRKLLLRSPRGLDGDHWRVQEWDWYDPDELRVARLDLALEHVAVLEAENERLSALLRQAGVDPESALENLQHAGVESTRHADGGSRPQSAMGPGAVTAGSSTEAKVALFRRLFHGRGRMSTRGGGSAVRGEPAGVRRRPIRSTSRSPMRPARSTR